MPTHPPRTSPVTSDTAASAPGLICPPVSLSFVFTFPFYLIAPVLFRRPFHMSLRPVSDLYVSLLITEDTTSSCSFAQRHLVSYSGFFPPSKMLNNSCTDKIYLVKLTSLKELPQVNSFVNVIFSTLQNLKDFSHNVSLSNFLFHAASFDSVLVRCTERLPLHSLDCSCFSFCFSIFSFDSRLFPPQAIPMCNELWTKKIVPSFSNQCTAIYTHKHACIL